MSKEALSVEDTLKLALEALEDKYFDRPEAHIAKTIAAIKEALAQPEQENKAFNDGVLEGVLRERAFWTKNRPEQEPVAWLGFNERGECREVFTRDMKKTLPNYPTEGMTPVYTTPYVATPRPQRKPLTDEQITALLVGLCVPKGYEGVTETFTAVVRAIEAAHGIKEKNT